jgi:hypothetical protein
MSLGPSIMGNENRGAGRNHKNNDQRLDIKDLSPYDPRSRSRVGDNTNTTMD